MALALTCPMEAPHTSTCSCSRIYTTAHPHTHAHAQSNIHVCLLPPPPLPPTGHGPPQPGPVAGCPARHGRARRMDAAREFTKSPLLLLLLLLLLLRRGCCGALVLAGSAGGRQQGDEPRPEVELAWMAAPPIHAGGCQHRSAVRLVDLVGQLIPLLRGKACRASRNAYSKTKRMI